MRARAASLAALTCLLLAGTHARADDAAQEPSPPLQASERRWYGYQTLIADGAAIALGGAGAVLIVGKRGDFSTSDVALPLGLIGVGVLTYAFAAPTVHWIHGRTLAGFASLGMRLLAPLLGAGIGALIPGIAGYDNTTGGIVGTIAGGAAAIALDATLLGYERVPVSRSAFSVSPRVSWTSTGARTFGLSGTF